MTIAIELVIPSTHLNPSTSVKGPCAMEDDQITQDTRSVDGDSGAPTELQILLQEYQSKDQHNQSLHRLVFQTAAIGFTLFIGLIAYMFPRTGMPEIVYWLLPLTYVIPYTLVLQLVYTMTFNSYYLRDIERSIAQNTGIPFFHYHQASTRALFSIRTGSLAYRTTYLLIFSVAIFLYTSLVYFSYTGLTSAVLTVPFQRLAAFMVMSSIIPIVMIWVSVVSHKDTRNLYERWIIRDDFESGSRGLLRLLLYALLPRPFDLIFKSTIFWGTFFLTTFALSVSTPTTLLGNAVLVYLCVDFLAKQTTYIWNDVLDFSRDSQHPHKQLRPLSRLGTRGFGKLLFLLRTGVVFGVSAAVGAMLGFWWLLLLVGAIFTWQVVYDRWGKSGEIRKLSVAALGYSERTIAAVLVVMAYVGSYDYILIALLIAWTVAFAFLFLSAYWWAEDDFLRRSNQPNKESWFLDKGQSVRLASNAMLFLIGSILAAVYSGEAASDMVPLLVMGSLVGITVMIVSHRAVNSKTRGLWLVAIALLSAGILTLAPRGSDWPVLAIATPTLLAVLYAHLSYEELTNMYVVRLLKGLLWKADRILFGEP